MMKSVLKRAWIFALLVGLGASPAPSGTEALATDPAPGARFHFVQITDTHLGKRDHLERTRRLVERINQLPYELACVVHTGSLRISGRPAGLSDDLSREMTGGDDNSRRD